MLSSVPRLLRAACCALAFSFQTQHAAVTYYLKGPGPLLQTLAVLERLLFLCIPGLSGCRPCPTWMPPAWGAFQGRASARWRGAAVFTQHPLCVEALVAPHH